MNPTPKWYMPVAVLALLWNLIGCAAYLSDVMMTPDAVAQLPADQQAMYAARPTWAVSATAIAVWGGALGAVGLILRKRWARPLLVASLAGIVAQDVGLLMMTRDPAALALQGVVLVIGIALVFLARKAAASGWLA
ncbi:MAG: hypothetical protein AB7O28_24440 [Vicinamibacterales bacterium]